MSVETYQEQFTSRLEQIPVSSQDKQIIKDGISLGILKPEDLVPSFIGNFAKRVRVAYHEIAHELEARHNDHLVEISSVIPEGSTLGYVVSKDTKQRPFVDALKTKMRIFIAGLYGEQKRGDTDHRGTGYDFSVVRYLGDLYHQYTGRSASAFISEQKSLVRDHIMGISDSYFKFKAHNLAYKGFTIG